MTEKHIGIVSRRERESKIYIKPSSPLSIGQWIDIDSQESKWRFIYEVVESDCANESLVRIVGIYYPKRWRMKNVFEYHFYWPLVGSKCSLLSDDEVAKIKKARRRANKSLEIRKIDNAYRAKHKVAEHEFWRATHKLTGITVHGWSKAYVKCSLFCELERIIDKINRKMEHHATYNFAAPRYNL